MRSPNSQLFEVLNLLDPETIIPTLEKGIEIEKLELIVNPDDERTKASIRNSRVLLSFFYIRKLGI